MAATQQWMLSRTALAMSRAEGCREDFAEAFAPVVGFGDLGCRVASCCTSRFHASSTPVSSSAARSNHSQRGSGDDARAGAAGVADVDVAQAAPVPSSISKCRASALGRYSCRQSSRLRVNQSCTSRSTISFRRSYRTSTPPSLPSLTVLRFHWLELDARIARKPQGRRQHSGARKFLPPTRNPSSYLPYIPFSPHSSDMGSVTTARTCRISASCDLMHSWALGRSLLPSLFLFSRVPNTARRTPPRSLRDGTCGASCDSSSPS